MFELLLLSCRFSRIRSQFISNKQPVGSGVLTDESLIEIELTSIKIVFFSYLNRNDLNLLPNNKQDPICIAIKLSVKKCHVGRQRLWFVNSNGHQCCSERKWKLNISRIERMNSFIIHKMFSRAIDVNCFFGIDAIYIFCQQMSLQWKKYCFN